MAGMGGEEERLEEEANNCSPPVRFPIRPVQCTIHTMSIFILRLYTVLYRELFIKLHMMGKVNWVMQC